MLSRFIIFLINTCVFFVFYTDNGLANRGRPRSNKGKSREGLGAAIYKKPTTPSEQKERQETIGEIQSRPIEIGKSEIPAKTSTAPQEQKNKTIQDFFTVLKSTKELAITGGEYGEYKDQLSLQQILKIPTSLRLELITLYMLNKEIPIFKEQLTSDVLAYLDISSNFLPQINKLKEKMATCATLEQENPTSFEQLNRIDFSKPLPKEIGQLPKIVQEFLNKFATEILSSMTSTSWNDLSQTNKVLINHEMIEILKDILKDIQVQGKTQLSIVTKLVEYSIKFFEQKTPIEHFEKEQEGIKQKLNEFIEILRAAPLRSLETKKESSQKILPPQNSFFSTPISSLSSSHYEIPKRIYEYNQISDFILSCLFPFIGKSLFYDFEDKTKNVVQRLLSISDDSFSIPGLLLKLTEGDAYYDKDSQTLFIPKTWRENLTPQEIETLIKKALIGHELNPFSSSEKINELKKKLGEEIFKPKEVQKQAINAFSQTLEHIFEENSPKSFLMVSPTGIGKTYVLFESLIQTIKKHQSVSGSSNKTYIVVSPLIHLQAHLCDLFSNLYGKDKGLYITTWGGINSGTRSDSFETAVLGAHWEQEGRLGNKTRIIFTTQKTFTEKLEIFTLQKNHPKEQEIKNKLMGIFVDEAHHLAGDKIFAALKIIREKFQNFVLYGTTATPFSAKEEVDLLELFQKNYFFAYMKASETISASISGDQVHKAISQGDLSPIRKWTRIDQKYLDKNSKLNPTMIADLVKADIIPLTKDHKKILVIAPNIKLITPIQEALKKEDPTAIIIALHSNAEGKKNDLIEQFKQITPERKSYLLAVEMMDEGTDIPSLSLKVDLNPSVGPRQLLQRLGRILRLFPGKKFVDVASFSSEEDFAEIQRKISEFSGSNKSYTLKRSEDQSSKIMPENYNANLYDLANEKKSLIEKVEIFNLFIETVSRESFYSFDQKSILFDFIRNLKETEPENFRFYLSRRAQSFLFETNNEDKNITYKTLLNFLTSLSPYLDSTGKWNPISRTLYKGNSLIEEALFEKIDSLVSDLMKNESSNPRLDYILYALSLNPQIREKIETRLNSYKHNFIEEFKKSFSEKVTSKTHNPTFKEYFIYNWNPTEPNHKLFFDRFISHEYFLHSRVGLIKILFIDRDFQVIYYQKIDDKLIQRLEIKPVDRLVQMHKQPAKNKPILDSMREIYYDEENLEKNIYLTLLEKEGITVSKTLTKQEVVISFHEYQQKTNRNLIFESFYKWHSANSQTEKRKIFYWILSFLSDKDISSYAQMLKKKYKDSSLEEIIPYTLLNNIGSTTLEHQALYEKEKTHTLFSAITLEEINQDHLKTHQSSIMLSELKRGRKEIERALSYSYPSLFKSTEQINQAKELALRHQDQIKNITSNTSEIDIIAPMPSTTGKPLTRQLSIATAEVLNKNNDVVQQVLSINSSEKKSPIKFRKNLISKLFNMADKFILIDPKSVSGKTILLVDDSLNTGITSIYAKYLLYKAGAKKVIILCFGDYNKKESDEIPLQQEEDKRTFTPLVTPVATTPEKQENKKESDNPPSVPLFSGIPDSYTPLTSKEAENDQTKSPSPLTISYKDLYERSLQIIKEEREKDGHKERSHISKNSSVELYSTSEHQLYLNSILLEFYKDDENSHSKDKFQLFQQTFKDRKLPDVFYKLNSEMFLPDSISKSFTEKEIVYYLQQLKAWVLHLKRYIQFEFRKPEKTEKLIGILFEKEKSKFPQEEEEAKERIDFIKKGLSQKMVHDIEHFLDFYFPFVVFDYTPRSVKDSFPSLLVTITNNEHRQSMFSLLRENEQHNLLNLIVQKIKYFRIILKEEFGFHTTGYKSFPLFYHFFEKTNSEEKILHIAIKILNIIKDKKGPYIQEEEVIKKMKSQEKNLVPVYVPKKVVPHPNPTPSLEKNLGSFASEEQNLIYSLYDNIPNLTEVFTPQLIRSLKVRDLTDKESRLLSEIFYHNIVEVDNIEAYIEFVKKYFKLKFDDLNIMAYAPFFQERTLDLKLIFNNLIQKFLESYFPISLDKSNVFLTRIKNIQSIFIISAPTFLRECASLEYRKTKLTEEIIVSIIRKNILFFQEVSQKEVINIKIQKFKRFIDVAGFYSFTQQTNSPEKVEALVQKITALVKSKIDDPSFWKIEQ